ncbi:MAG TPA: efflux RND transporter periplasmic adaptor subunit [Methylocella sp.]|nr:efflux RND transporter periplasmic adaptor subunit [Methylocella sp.]
MNEQAKAKPFARQSPPLAEKWLPQAQRRRRGGLLVISIVSIFAAAIGTVWWNSSRGPSLHYLTTPATRGSITRVANATGTVNPVLTIIVGAYVSGTIQKVFCDYNTLVKAGQICAKIDPRPYKAILDQYVGQLARDQGFLAQAQMDLSRYQKLAEQNSIARQQAEDQFYAVQQDTGTVKLDESLVEGAKVNLAYTDIVSPVEGVVVSRAVTQGQTVASSFQTPTLFLIATDLADMQVDTNTSESDIGGVKLGDAATFTVDAYPRRIFQGTIVQVRESPQTVQNVVTFDAVVGVNNDDLALMPGMTASTRIIVANKNDVIRVPNQALRYSPGGLTAVSQPASAPPAGTENRVARVWVLHNATPTAVSVVPGLDDDSFTEIVKGDVKLGDLIIVGEERGKQ